MDGCDPAAAVSAGKIDELSDIFVPDPTQNSELLHQGPVVSVVRETFELAGRQVQREVAKHPSAAAIVALNENNEVLLIRQYRHPVRGFLLEVPAGLLTGGSEDPLECAQRELVEEAGFEARVWQPLISFFTTPGGSDERLHIFTARDLFPAATGRTWTGEAEEADLPQLWIPLMQAQELVLSGRITNPATVVGVLAAVAALE